MESPNKCTRSISKSPIRWGTIKVIIMENFAEQIKSLAKRVQKLKDSIHTEEATKTSIVMPFFQSLGYDIFNPEEFVPEFTADVGIKKGEKVDYAILQNGNPTILIETKSIQEKLEKHDSQLFRYFGTTTAKFAILTNGIIYRFYTDLDEQNKMDSVPFFEFNMFDIRDHQIIELQKFAKINFDVDHIINTASELKYTNEIKQFLKKQWENPSDEFIKFILADIYPGLKTKQVVEKFSGIVQKSLKQFMNDFLNDKLKTALETTNIEVSNISAAEEVAASLEAIKSEPEIITTEEELEGYITVKVLLQDCISVERIFYRDNQSYFNILVDDNIRKWICRLHFNRSNNKSIVFNDENKTTYSLEKVSDIMKYKEDLTRVATSFI